MKNFRLNKVYVILFPVFLMLISIHQNVFSQSENTKLEIQKMATVLQIIDYAYVDSVDLAKVVDDAITNSLRDLDPHSAYIPKDEVEKANEPLEGSFEGIGVTFQLFKDTIMVISPVEGGPSERPSPARRMCGPGFQDDPALRAPWEQGNDNSE